MSFGALDGAGVAPFVFGKLPAHGDFISRGLDDETIEAADAAVAEAITLAALRWDYRWDDIYVETPVWRFVAAPGVLGREWTAGVFMASVDAVGRQFPLVAGFSAPTLALIARGDTLAAALDDAESCARAALLEGRSVDAVLAAFEAAARRFEPQPSDDPGEAFAAAALLRGHAAGWAPEGVFWVAGAPALMPVTVTGALSGETLSGLFIPLPAPEPALEPALEPAAEPAPIEGQSSDLYSDDAVAPEPTRDMPETAEPAAAPEDAPETAGDAGLADAPRGEPPIEIAVDEPARDEPVDDGPSGDGEMGAEPAAESEGAAESGVSEDSLPGEAVVSSPSPTDAV